MNVSPLGCTLSNTNAANASCSPPNLMIFSEKTAFKEDSSPEFIFFNVQCCLSLNSTINLIQKLKKIVPKEFGL